MGFIGNMYLFINSLYKQKDLISQWHLAVIRNSNSVLAEKLGADCGVDCVGNTVNGNDLIMMLDAINKNSGLPKTITHSMNQISPKLRLLREHSPMLNAGRRGGSAITSVA